MIFDQIKVEVKQPGTNGRKPMIFWHALFRTYKGKLIAGGLMKLVHDVLQFSGPLILKYISRFYPLCRFLSFFFSSRRVLNFLSEPTGPTWLGIFYSILLGSAVFCQTLFLQAYFHRQFTVGVRFRSAITGLIYRKVSRSEKIRSFVFQSFRSEFKIIKCS